MYYISEGQKNEQVSTLYSTSYSTVYSHANHAHRYRVVVTGDERCMRHCGEVVIIMFEGS